MWVWIVIAVVMLGIAVVAFWPRAGGITDRSALSARRRTQGGNESVVNSNRTQFPPF